MQQPGTDNHGSWEDTCQAYPSGVAVCVGGGVFGHGVQGVGRGEGEGARQLENSPLWQEDEKNHK